MSADPLRGPLLKIERANKHIHDLKRAAKEFLFGADAIGNHYAFFVEDDPDGIHVVRKLRKLIDMPDVITAMVGDAVHNLRSALDHLAYLIAVRHDPTVDASKTEFVICNSKSEYDTLERAQRKKSRLGPSGIAFLDGVQPYQGGYGHDLWLLHRLDIIDKHRALLTTALRGGKPTLDRDSSGTTMARFKIDWHALEEDMPVSKWRKGDPERHNQVAFQIAFSEPGIPNDVPVTILLELFSHLVETTIKGASSLV